MKRRFFTLLLTLLAALSLASAVSADVIWEPDDSFYGKHRQECTHVGRRYELAGYDGTVTVFTAPGGVSKAVLDNGAQGRVQFTWAGSGITWGYICWLGGLDDEGGWVAMDDLSLVYDSQQFIEDHEEEIEKVEWGREVPVDFRQAVHYSYPNGTTAGAVLKENLEYLPFSQAFSGIYTDENGLRWGYVDYYMGPRDFWVCMDDPMNANLDTGVVPVAPSAAQTRGSATVSAGASPLPLAAGLVAAVTAVTALLILKLKKRTDAN